jgi:hypothetical protein
MYDSLERKGQIKEEDRKANLLNNNASGPMEVHLHRSFSMKSSNSQPKPWSHNSTVSPLQRKQERLKQDL